MYFKGCDNSKTAETYDETKRISARLKEIFGEKPLNIMEFPSGQGVYDEKQKKWVDKKEYRAERPQKRKAFLIGGKRDTKITLVKPNGKVKDGSFTGYKREPILKMEYH